MENSDFLAKVSEIENNINPEFFKVKKKVIASPFDGSTTLHQKNEEIHRKITGLCLWYLRTQKGVTTDQLALDTGISKMDIIRMERGKDPISRKKMRALSDYLGVDHIDMNNHQIRRDLDFLISDK